MPTNLVKESNVQKIFAFLYSKDRSMEKKQKAKLLKVVSGYADNQKLMLDSEIEDQIVPVHQYETILTTIIRRQIDCPIELKPTCAPQFVRIAEQNNVPTRFTRGCLTGLRYCIISPIGDVQPCAYLDIPLGNVRETPFDVIWKDNAHLQRLRTEEYSGKCSQCGYQKKCGGCRARAYYVSNDYMAEDPYCDYIPNQKS